VRYLLALVVVYAFAFPAAAQHAHGTQKGPNGGQLEDVAGVHAELMILGSRISINVFDEANKPVPTKGFTAAALVVLGADRETVTLSASGDNALVGDAKKAIPKGATVSVTLKTAAGRSGQARFRY
jgi:hypothetical protein